MHIKRILLFLVVLSVFNSCSSPQEKALKKINSFEDELFNSDVLEVNRVKALQLVDAYVDYANTYPIDTISAQYLFRAGDIAMNMNQPARAISIFNDVINAYPEFDKCDESLFLIGFIYENYLNDYQKADKFYKSFLDRYPESEFANDAQISIINLGKTPEQLIKEFEEKQKETS